MSLDFRDKLEQYANLTLEVGLGFQVGQRLTIAAQVNAAPFVRLITRAAYQRGARFVEVLWEDDEVQLARHQLAPRDSFEVFSDWQASALNDMAQRGDALLYVVSTNPSLLEGQDETLVQLEKNTLDAARGAMFERLISSQFNWCVVATSSVGWAHSVFPKLEAEAATEKLWDAIFQATLLTQPHPLEAWRVNLEQLHARREILNAKQYRALRFRGEGTHLEVGLVEGHRWKGGQTATPGGVLFAANLPSFEVYTMPHRERTNGTVRGTKPTVIGGSLVEGWSLEFKDGVVVKASAKRGEAVLHKLLETDEGAKRLGEVALVPGDSPVAATGILFQNTLLDENAASHIALGRAYPDTLQGGPELEAQDFIAAGGNKSLEHHDVMMGSNDVDVDGVFQDGSSELLMRSGQFVFEGKS